MPLASYACEHCKKSFGEYAEAAACERAHVSVYVSLPGVDAPKYTVEAHFVPAALFPETITVFSDAGELCESYVREER